MNKENICPCCEEHCFEIYDNNEICPICQWEDDSLQRKRPNYRGGANDLSLNEYRQRWLNRKEAQAV